VIKIEKSSLEKAPSVVFREEFKTNPMKQNQKERYEFSPDFA
jgi:hypothetical protein